MPRLGYVEIKDVLKEPFGPYPEYEVLPDDSDPEHTKSRLPLILHDLELLLDSKPSGLNYTESLKSDGDVEFLGVIEVTSASMLSKAGYEKLRKDVLKRNLTLDTIFKDRPANGLIVKVAIIGKKRLNVVYLGSKAVPNGLLLISHHRRHDGSLCSRKFHVVSIHDYCYAKSLLYLRRWRFRHLIMILTSKHDPKPKCKWLREKYIELNRADGVYVESPEVWTMFAGHAEWLLYEQSLTKAKFIDVPSWEKFLRSVQGGYVTDTEDDSDEDMDVDEDDTPTMRVTRSASKAKLQKPGSPTSPVPLFDPDIEEIPMPVDQSLEYTDDSSPEVSSPERSPSPERFIDPNLFALIPLTYYEEPPVPMSFKWRCETECCSYAIDLLDLTDENVKGLDDRLVNSLRKKRWILSDGYLKDAFQSMVHNHRLDHLRSWNIGVREIGLREAKFEFYWIKHPPSQSSLSQYMAFKLLGKRGIKTED